MITMSGKNKQDKQPENPVPVKHPEIKRGTDPVEIIPEEDPEIIPFEDPLEEEIPPDEPPSPGEGP